NIINYLDIAYISPLKALLDEEENSIYKAYGGEIEFNNFEINMLDERGKENKFTIRSGKNLQDLEEEISDMGDDFATALIMSSSDGLYLPNNEILYSSYANQYDRYFYKVIKCDDVSLEDLITENSSEADIEEAKQTVYAQLRERGKKYFNAQNDRLFGSYTINFIELA
ncbi:phage tail spike protein, partial [Clostridium neonatale]